MPNKRIFSVMGEFLVGLVLLRGLPVFLQLGSRNLTNANVNRFVRGYKLPSNSMLHCCVIMKICKYQLRE